MKFEIDFNDDDSLIVEKYMQDTNMTISEVARQAILEMIFNDDADLATYERALKEYRENPTTHSLAQFRAKLGLA